MFSETRHAYGDNESPQFSAATQGTSPSRTRAQDGRKHPLVLVVDDDDDTREAVQTLLELDGYRVAAAVDGQEALELLERGLRPELILLDLNMPRMDGVAFRRAQRNHPAFAEIPVIVCSGSLGYDPAKAALGAVAFLQKPMAVDHLMDVVHRQCPL